MTIGKPPALDSALVAGLLRAAAYPHPVSEPIRLAETHISWVLLTGEFAYKLKKPLRLSFLDYSTLERRQALCEEEVRLNCRHAPELYLGVSTINGSVATPRVDGTGAVLEYAVRMRQFAARDELVALLDRDAVTALDLAALGESVAHLHLGAAPAPPDAAFGWPDAVQRITFDNFAELRRLPEAVTWHDVLQCLEERLSSQHAARSSLMRERREQDWVRECHGDLHCGNVVRWQGRLTPFDGIEFDPGLRFIDVVNDVAFLAMDLAERGRDDLRLAALQAWLETIGDFAGLPLLQYYETYRALVRAKVAALRALQFAADAPSRVAAIAECSRYLAWASGRVQDRAPVLVITCGLSGSGKTWLARRLREPLRALHVRSDIERKRLAGLAPGADSKSPPDAGIYTRDYTVRTYDRLHDHAGAALRGGESIIVDAAFLRRDERLRFLALAESLHARSALVHCHAPTETLRQRVAARSEARSDASEAGLDVLQRQPSWWEDFSDTEQAHLIELDTTQTLPLATLVEQILSQPA
jgi:aminoglycoside phosphotransferase family enzyme/predicted kinase